MMRLLALFAIPVISGAVLLGARAHSAPPAGPAQARPPETAAAAPPPQAPPAEAPPGSCTRCHGALIKQTSSHAAAEDCASCHEQEGRAHRFKLAATGPDLCGRCHDMVEGRKHVHGPAAVGDCLSCHDPHGSTQPHLVTRSGPAVCESCHVEMTALRGARKYTHDPVKKDCAGCHNPHSSNLKYQLRADGAALCANCHKTPRLDHQVTVKHAAAAEGRQCLNCHDAHAADVQPQLRGATMPLCLGCHDRPVKLSDGGVLLNMKEWLAGNPDAHGPIREQDCVSCHRPHDSEQTRLLRMDYPAKFYSPFDPKNYQLCFACHEPDLVRAERTTSLTGFRDGDRNLHFLHVNRPEKGRTCRACHEVHSSRKPRHIREKVPFGSWSLPINYDARKDGGYCAPGCHIPYEYRRTKGADNGPAS